MSIEKQHPFWFLIYGFNMAIVAALFAGLFGRLLGPRKGALAAVLGISIYTILVGANAAVVRAAIMGELSIFARQVGRRQHGFDTLAFTSAVMGLSNPPEWITNLNPQLVLLSVSAQDGEGRPSLEMLEIIQGYTLLRTDRNGWIEMVTDGAQLWVEVEGR